MMNGYEIVNFIGEGSFSSIFHVRDVSQKTEFVLKKFKFESGESELKRVFERFRKLSQITHPNLIKNHEIAYDEKNKQICILLEYADRGDLQTKLTEFLHLGKILEEDQIWSIFFQLLKALKSLHSQKNLHRALKPSNVLLTSSGGVKLTDVNIFEDGGYSKIATPSNYMSPELWEGAAFSEKTDIWSLGCLVYEMAMLKPAFRGENLEELRKKILRGYFPALPKGDFSADLEKLIQTLLKVDAIQRPNAKQLLEMEFIIKNFNSLIEKNAFQNGLHFPEIKHVYTNNPFQSRAQKQNKKQKKVQKLEQKTDILPESPIKKMTISSIYENPAFEKSRKELTAKVKTPRSNQAIRKMKESFEKTRIRKDFELNNTLTPQLVLPYQKSQCKLLELSIPPISGLSYKFLKKYSKSKRDPPLLRSVEDQGNESHHFIDLNNETKLPVLERSRISLSKDRTCEDLLTDRKVKDKKFQTKNVSYNQIMINRFRSENPEIRGDRIISLKEIHQRFIMN